MKESMKDDPRQKTPSETSGQSPRPHTHRQRRSTLLSRNIRIGRHRTSVRLEPIFWDILGHILEREQTSVHKVCTQIAERAPNLPLTSAIRIFLIAYAWRAGMSSALEAVKTGKINLF